MRHLNHYFENIALPLDQVCLLRAGETVPDNGMIIRPHMHMQYEIMWFRSASGTYTINNQSFEIADNTLVYIAPLVLHDMQLLASPGHQRFLFQYDETLLNDLGILVGEARSQRSAVLALVGEDAERLQMLFTWFTQLRMQHNRLADEVMRLLVQSVYENLSRSDDHLDVTEHDNALGRVISLVRHFEKSKVYSLSLEQAAMRCKLSKSHFSRVFKDVMNMKYTDYLLNRKITHALYLLTRTDLNITEIAYACDFTDSAYFCYRFRHAVGVSPRTYRQHGKTTRQLSNQHDRN
ncbi:UNVERIFIED_ORG: AraC-like DNA-binding protein [Pseudomonas lini]